MTKLNKLAQRIRSLPEIENERSKLTLVQRVRHDAEIIASELASILKQSPYIDEMTSGGMLDFAKESIPLAVNQTIILKKLIKRENFGSEQKISEALDNLTKRKQSLEAQRAKMWINIQSEIKPVEIVLGIAEKLELESVPSLKSAVSTFKKVTASPPSNRSDHTMIVESLEQNKIVLSNSGLTGNVGKILKGAIDAQGDPKLLFEEDVKCFFKNHPALWESLKLKLA